MIPLAAIMAGAQIIGKLAGKTSSNRATARVNEAGLNAEADRLALEKAGQDAVNARANVATDTDYRAKQTNAAIRGGLLKGITDASITRPAGIPTVSVQGGLRPSAIAGKDAMGDQFQRDAMLRYMQGAPGLKGDSAALTPLPKAGKFDKLLNVVSGIGGLAGIGGELASLGKPSAPDISGAESQIGNFAMSGGMGNGALNPEDVPDSLANRNKYGLYRQPRFTGVG